MLLLVRAGVMVSSRLSCARDAPSSVVVRVIEDGAAGGPQVIGTTVVLLR